MATKYEIQGIAMFRKMIFRHFRNRDIQAGFFFSGDKFDELYLATSGGTKANREEVDSDPVESWSQSEQLQIFAYLD